MTRIELYKEISRAVDYHINIINDLKIKNNKPTAKHFYNSITSLVKNYYLFQGLTLDAKNYFMNRIENNNEWIFK